MPGILGVVDPRLPLAERAMLARAMASRVRVADSLRANIEPAFVGPAVVGCVGLADCTPVASADGRCRVVLHGRVTGADARTILDEYLEHGEAALRGRSGSFALALWDARLGRLHLVNDRFGLRNVYYAATSDRLVFAPLVAALLEDARIARTLDAQAAAEFLTFQCVLGDRTLVEDVHLLPPASLLVFEVGQGVRIERTWRLRYRVRPGDGHPRMLGYALRQATARLADGAGRVGLPLSGGLDSRTLLAATPSRPLVTVSYGRQDSDDLLLAARLAQIAATEHHEIVLAPGYIEREARTMVERTDGMHSCLNAHAALLREAGRFADTILLGNGGDCLLDGLWTGDADATTDAMVDRLLPKLTLGITPRVAAAVVAPGAPFAVPTARAAGTLRTLLASADGDTAHDRADAFNVVHRHRRWVLQGVPAQATHVDFRHPYYDDQVVEAALAVPPALRADRRAHVEALKLLSPALARVRRQGKPFSFSVPAWRWQLDMVSIRVRDGIRWRANRAGLNPFLARPNRRSFADYDDELRHGSRALLDGLLSPAVLERGWWRPEVLAALVAELVAGRANHAAALGVVLTLELWAAETLAAAPLPLQRSA
jgi:asparagine synthase (glutamine-hydrolysing)